MSLTHQSRTYIQLSTSIPFSMYVLSVALPCSDMVMDKSCRVQRRISVTCFLAYSDRMAVSVSHIAQETQYCSDKICSGYTGYQYSLLIFTYKSFFYSSADSVRNAKPRVSFHCFFINHTTSSFR